MAEQSMRRLERELRELGGRLRGPQAPDVTATVLARLEPSIPPASRPARRAPARRRRLAVAAAVVVLAGLLLAAPGVRAAVLNTFRFAGIEVHLGGRHPPPDRARLPAETATSLEDARRRAAFPVRVPAALNAPDRVTVSGGTPPRVVSLLYRPGPGRPGAIRLDQFDGTATPTFRKYLTGGGQVERVSVDGQPALWFPFPHTVFYVDRDGRDQVGAARLAGSTLIWQAGTVTLRLEGRLTRDEALAIANSARS